MAPLKLLHHPAMPEIQFPSFDGSNPRLWIKDCLSYFTIYQVDPSMWIRYSTMHLTGSAKLWFQTIQSNIYEMSWENFCALVCAKFDKNEHNLVFRQFFHIRQTSSVTDYIERFSDTIHQLLAHEPTFSPTAITNRFVDGLKHEIKCVVMMHKPQNLDSASALALLQEEALLGPNMYNKKEEGSSYYKKVYSEQSKQFSFSPSNTPRFPSSPTEEKKSPKTVKNKNMKDRLTTLKNYRRAKGLCYKCGEKWYKGHQCQNVSLQAMEEVWSFVSDDSPTLPVHEAHDVDSDSSDELCEILVEAMQGIDHHATMRLIGFIADQEVYMLIDSGSSHCFISEACAARILGHQQLQETVQVKVTNGQYIQCSHEIPNQLWHIQGVTFRNTFKILPLTSYDVIVGMDWLLVNSPMNMHWVKSGLF